MWKSIFFISFLIGYCSAGPFGSKHHVRLKSRQDRHVALADAETYIKATELKDVSPSTVRTAKMSLPSNATKIRAEIKDGFFCEGRVYGYYADIENDCQIFHVCMPVTYGDGKEHYFRWSFICPEDTIFSQDSFTCMHRQNMVIDCKDSMKYYELNRNFGVKNEDKIQYEEDTAEIDETRKVDKPSLSPEINRPEFMDKPFKPVQRKPIKNTYNTQQINTISSTIKPKATEAPELEPTTKLIPVKVQKRPINISNIIKSKPPTKMVKKPQKATSKPETVTPEMVEDKLSMQQLASEKTEVTQKPLDMKDKRQTTAKTEAEIISTATPTAQKQIIVTDLALTATTEPIMLEEEQRILKQTAGGFEDADPTMAAEAEALINDFLQTMMNAPKSGLSLDSVAEKPTDNMNPMDSIKEAITENSLVKAKTTENTSNNLESLSNLVTEKVISKTAKKEQISQNIEAYRPISIDDVVASVKERLDQPHLEVGSVETLKESLPLNEEKIIVPIYHRPELTQTADKSETESQSTKFPEKNEN